MSRFLDRLERVSRGAPPPMGFGAAAHREQVAALGCIGIVRDGKTPKAEVISKGSLDAILIAGDSPAPPSEEARAALGETPWGLWAASLEPDAAKAYKEAGCDFLVLDAHGVQLAALESEDIGYFLAVPANLEDRLLRSIESLPIDGVFLVGASLEPPLTLEHLMLIGAVRSMFGKYLMAEVSPKVSAKELEKLRDVGVEAVVVDLKGLTGKALGELHEHILAVPRQRKERGERMALVPHLAPGQAVPPQEEEEEEEF